VKNHIINQQQITLSLIVLLILLFAGSCRRENPGSLPNILIVFPDQMRGQAMGFLGEEPVLTPNIDMLASEGLVFTQAVSNYPVCSPFRAMFMTGQYPHTNGVLSNCNSRSAPHGYELKKDAVCWSDILKENGYDLGYIGKWHLDSPFEPYVESYNNRPEMAWNEWCSPERRHGFDFWYAYGTYDQHNNPMYWSTNAKRDEAKFAEQWGPEHEADVAINYLENKEKNYRNPDKPFALVVSMNPPHMPYNQVPQNYVDRYDHLPLDSLCHRPNIPEAGTKWGDYYRKHIRNYYAMITGVDDQFGRILKKLEELDLKENTLVLFFSDHGNCLGIHDMISKNNHYEESMRIPFIISWPGKIDHRIDDLLISVPDFYPTLLGLLDLNEKTPASIHGEDYSSLIMDGSGNRPESQFYIWVPLGQPEWGHRGIRNHSYTLMISKMPDQPDEIILHNNVTDPYQLVNIAEQKPDIVKELTSELKSWLERTGDPWLKHLNHIEN